MVIALLEFELAYYDLWSQESQPLCHENCPIKIIWSDI